ncbi:MAG: FtsK/SpoIIIE domain-containing protein [Anaerolineae bacterium]|nr:FtsK/SpoIIIE domain-containing protein [Anaerolineae bacterium]
MATQNSSTDPRIHYLEQTRTALVTALARGVAGEPVPCQSDTIVGPRAGAVLLQAGMATAKVLRLLSADGAAIARQFISWNFPGEPGVFLSGKLIRVEAPWPDSLAQTQIRYRDVHQNPRGGGRWIAGVDERGVTIIMGVSDTVPHILTGGTTGSGKTVAMRNAAAQLSRQATEVSMVCIDGKYGAGLGPLSGLPGMVGPVATDIRQATNALGWINLELQRRYTIIAAQGESAIATLPRIMLLFDEFQEFMDDAGVRELTRRILAQGRAARIHAMLATQHPTVEAFGEHGALKRNLVGRVALRVTDQDASRVVVGDSLPRADRLMGRGDAYAVIPGHVHRVQLLLIDEAELQAMPREEPSLREWPETNPEDYGAEPTVRWAYSGEELAWGLIGAAQTPQWGRDRLGDALEAAGLARPGAERGIRLLDLTQDTLTHLQSADYDLARSTPPEERTDDIEDVTPTEIQEMALGLAAAVADWGRKHLKDAFNAAGLAIPGSERADRILDLGEAIMQFLASLGYQVKVERDDGDDNESEPYSPEEIAKSVIAASRGWGRDAFVRSMAPMGNERGMQLLRFGRRVRDRLAEENCQVQVETEPEDD